jgi:RimJ/RimL family protein N-acetyltransferase
MKASLKLDEDVGAHVTLGADTVATLRMFPDDHGDWFGEIVDVKVSEELRGNAIAPQCIARLIGYAFGHAKATRIKAYALPENAASIRVWEKLGFIRQPELHHHETGIYAEFILSKGASAQADPIGTPVVRSFDVPATSAPPKK